MKDWVFVAQPLPSTSMSKRKPRKRRTLADQLRKAIKDSDQTVNAISQGAGIPQPVLSELGKWTVIEVPFLTNSVSACCS